MKRAELRNVREVRHWGLSGVEVREDADGGVLRFSGYATVFEAAYEVHDVFGAYQERIAPTAFNRTLHEDPDVVLVVNHEGLPLARTKSGTLRLSTDSVGLRVDAELDPQDPDVRALLPKMRRGDVDEMSFAFRVNDQVWNSDYSDRLITEVNLHRGDVSIVTFGANPHTLAALRAALADETVREQLVAQIPEAAAALDAGAAEEPDDVTEAEPAGDDVDVDAGPSWQVAALSRLIDTKVPPTV